MIYPYLKILRLKYFIYLWCVIFVLFPKLGFSQPSLNSKDKQDPIEITSERMRSENNGHKIIFSGNVKSIWGDLEMNSDVLEIYSQGTADESKPKNKKFTEGQELDEIIAIGSVKITKGDRRAEGDRAIYYDKQQKIILTGKPYATAWEGKNIIKGREMIFFLEKDRFDVNKRVRLTLFPKSQKNSKKSRVSLKDPAKNTN